MSALPQPFPTRALDVSIVQDLAGFRALEAEWNALVVAHNNQLFLRHELLRVWLTSFAPRATLRILVARDGDGRLVAVLPLRAESTAIRGIPVREYAAIANPHSCRFDMIAEDPGEASQAFLRFLLARRDWDVLRITDVAEGGQAWHLHRAAQAAGLPVGAWESQRSPYLALPATEDGLAGRISSQMRSNARRRRRQMEKQAPVEIERVDGGDTAAVLEDFFRVEQSGWKGREGTACSQDEQTRAFYTQLAEVAARQGWLSLFRLKLDGKTIAFHYGLTYGGSYLLPKLGYDEAFRDFSPGLVLMHEVIRDSVARRLGNIDFLGSDDDWKLRWSRQVLRHHWLYVFRGDLKGRLLEKLKFAWVPWFKKVLGRTDGTAAASSSEPTTEGDES
jgi:CelD/BcsL family acetyltransferase involved in cellulose biosynthesis